METDDMTTTVAASSNNSTTTSSLASKKLSIKFSKFPAKSIVASSKLSILDDHATSKEEKQIKKWEDESKLRYEGKAPPLVIPAAVREGDVEAVRVLEREAGHVYGQHSEETTNFSSQGSIIIPTSGQKKQKKSLLMQPRANLVDADEHATRTETEQFLKDVSHRPEELVPTDVAYRAVPVHEFGAALLRGMGWKGDENPEPTKVRTDDTFLPKVRHHRLGLGATLAPMISSSSADSQKPSIISTKKRHFATTRTFNDVTEKAPEVEGQGETVESKEQKLVMRKQSSLCDGSIVYVQLQEGSESTEGRRAVVLQTSGVPGLNRIRLQYEGDQEEFIVSKDRVTLVPYQRLKLNPFRLQGNCEQGNHTVPSSINEATLSEKKLKRQDEGRYQGNGAVMENVKLGEDKKTDDVPSSLNLHPSHKTNSSDRGRKEVDNNYYSKPSKGDHSKDKERDHSSRLLDEKYSTNYHQVTQQQKVRDRSDIGIDHQHHWIIPNIRVRVISRKVGGGKYYKSKGIVVDTSQPGKGTLQMDLGNSILEGVKQKYLETALPKIGGYVMILSGRKKFQCGKLLERNSNACTGVVQLSESMDLVSIPLDDIAEWCGPLNEDNIYS